MDKRLIYVHDPMCSWCWGFAETWQAISEKINDDLPIVRLLGGLAPDSDESMPEEMQQMLQQTWRHIEQVIPGKKFNFEFWSKCTPRRSTYPACRAVIAAREQGEQYDELMTSRIQKAYYQQARNPSDDTTLIDLAEDIGLDRERFAIELQAEATNIRLLREISTARAMGVNGFPSVLLQIDNQIRRISTDYNDARAMLAEINAAATM